jgi:uncharacterized membrane protein YhaH (DUF805 family)
MKGEVLHYDDNSGQGQISGADGIRYSFSRADLKQLVPISKGSKVDFDFEGKQAKDIYIDAAAPAHFAGTSGSAPYSGAIEPDLGLWGYFMRAYTSKFASFSGRARRKEYWALVLFNVIIWIILYAVIFAGFASLGSGAYVDMQNLMAAMGQSPIILIGGGLMILWGLISILPGIGLMVRRMHDLGQTGWIAVGLLVLSVIPYVGFIGSIALLVIGFLKGQPGENKYGPPVAPAA